MTDQSDNQKRLSGLTGGSSDEAAGPLPWDDKPTVAPPSESGAPRPAPPTSPPSSAQDASPSLSSAPTPSDPVVVPSAGGAGSGLSSSEYGDPVKLFNRPAWKDPAFFVGWIIAVLLAVPRAITNGTQGLSFSVGGVVSGSIDGAFFIAVSFVLFCLLPALIRKLVRKSRLKKPPVASAAPGFYPDPVRRGQERLWDGNQWTATARGAQPPRSGAVGVLVLVIAGTVLVGLIALAASWASSSTRIDDSAVGQAYQDMLSSVANFEEDAESAAQSDGPTGLARYVIANGDSVELAARQLETELARADLPADHRPDPALLRSAAEVALSYGEALRLLAADLSMCTDNDIACYQSVFSQDDSRAQAARRDLYNISNTIYAQSQGD